MDILGEKKFIELPGEKTHELPPLLVRDTADVKRLDRVMNLAGGIVETDDMLPDLPGDRFQAELEHDRRKMDLAVNLVDQYVALIRHWQWGDSILEWIRQCEITFGTRLELRNLLRPDVWPHAGRSSFVTLLADKSVKTSGVELHKAVGLRLTFRQPPPISCFSNQFLFYLNGTVASTAYDTWAHLSPDPISCLPPERFKFDIVNMSVQ
jgi:hypothetical protein